ncbi:MAG: hypothetical protein V3S44_09455 [Alphaproteobacteria bacterium]
MQRRHLIPLIALAVIVLPVLKEALAETNESLACGKRADMLAQLSTRYSEEPVAMGMATNGTLVEILASGGGSSFTILYTTAEGLTCMMAAGNDWESIDVILADANA